MKNRQILSSISDVADVHGIREGHSLLKYELSHRIINNLSKDADASMLLKKLDEYKRDSNQLISKFYNDDLLGKLFDSDNNDSDRDDGNKKKNDIEKIKLYISNYNKNTALVDELSIIDVEKELSSFMGITITSEEKLIQAFGERVIRLIYDVINIQSFKDNLLNKASDNIICMNYALLFVYDFYNPSNMLHGIPLCRPELQDELTHRIENLADNLDTYSEAVNICFKTFSGITPFLLFISDEVILLHDVVKLCSTDEIHACLYAIIRIYERIRNDAKHSDKEKREDDLIDIDKLQEDSKRANELNKKCTTCSNQLIHFYVNRIKDIDLKSFELEPDEEMISNVTYEAANVIRGFFNEQRDYSVFCQHMTYILSSTSNTAFIEISAQLLIYLKNEGAKYYDSIKKLIKCNSVGFKESFVKNCSETDFIEALDDSNDINLVVDIAENFAELRISLNDWRFFDELIYDSIYIKDWFISIYEIVNRLYIYGNKGK
ncbi:MAG: hypothetical protein J6M45_01125 [Pseudobutyrivibrio sp.]|nr:hypothetical protein [Pseudobutyrivibrio sp.]